MELPKSEGAQMDRATLATAQVLPAISRTAVVTPDVAVSEDDCTRAARLARASYPMYEGYLTFGDIYAANVGIIRARVMEPGDE